MLEGELPGSKSAIKGTFLSSQGLLKEFGPEEISSVILLVPSGGDGASSDAKHSLLST